jgi:predicted choloylglycine hydrolase
MMSRRDFLRYGVAGGATIACASDGALKRLFAETKDFTAVKKEATRESFPLLKVSGSPFEIGRAIGKTFTKELREAFERREKWFANLKRYAAGEGKENLRQMMKASEDHFPDIVQELGGWAEGSGISYEDLFILNCNNEFEAFLEEDKRPPGDCSTVILNHGGRLIVAHNEDGNGNFSDLMFVLQARLPEGTEFIALTYPGCIEGNAPAFNNHGIIVATNYIGSHEVKAGVPRYFISRKMLEAKTIEEALEIARNPLRSHSYHHIVASLRERRAFSIETVPSRYQVKEIRGLYLHTNHLILDRMKNQPQFDKYVRLSSLPRLESLKKSLGGIKDLSTITPAMIITALSSHEGRPYSVCRHPEGEAEGATLGMGFFDSQEMGKACRTTMCLYRNNPCRGNHKSYTL